MYRTVNQLRTLLELEQRSHLSLIRFKRSVVGKLFNSIGKENKEEPSCTERRFYAPSEPKLTFSRGKKTAMDTRYLTCKVCFGVADSRARRPLPSPFRNFSYIYTYRYTHFPFPLRICACVYIYIYRMYLLSSCSRLLFSRYSYLKQRNCRYDRHYLCDPNESS